MAIPRRAYNIGKRSDALQDSLGQKYWGIVGSFMRKSILRGFLETLCHDYDGLMDAAIPDEEDEEADYTALATANAKILRSLVLKLKQVLLYSRLKFCKKMNLMMITTMTMNRPTSTYLLPRGGTFASSNLQFYNIFLARLSGVAWASAFCNRIHLYRSVVLLHCSLPLI